jgi:biopolymer transport protein TolR
MAIDIGHGYGNGNGNGYRGSGGRFRRTPISQINVTPMVDVMLVLLVVFMITAPLLTVGVPVDLPKTDASRIVYLQDAVVALDELAPRLTAISANRRDARIFVRGDRAIAYGQVMAVMGALNQAGFNRVALITEKPGKAAPGSGRKASVR